MKKMEKRLITFEEATTLLNDGESIHTFRNGNGMLLGADYKREELLKIMKQHENTVFGLGVSATLLELSILAQTIWWHYAKPVLSDSFIFFVGWLKQI